MKKIKNKITEVSSISVQSESSRVLVFGLVCAVLFTFFLTATSFAAGVSKKSTKSDVELEYETKDGFLIHSTLGFPKSKQAKFPLVVLIHSIGYSSKYWLNMPEDFKKAGFAVLSVDLRGHGKSIYNKNFKKHNWVYMSSESYKKYPSDILGLLQYVNENYKNVSVTHTAIIGADIGANTAILACDKLKYKPKALVLISPSAKFKGLYTPIALANLSNIPILVAVSAKDKHSIKEANYLKRFAQSEFDIKTYPFGGTGMLMLKVNKGMDINLVNWVVMKFNTAAKKK